MTGAISLSRRTLAVVAAAALAIASLALPAQGGERSALAPRAATATAAAAVDSALTNLRHGVVKVIVQKHHQPAATTQPTATQPTAGTQPATPAPSSGPTTPEQTVANVGGHVTHDLPIIDGFAATLPAAAIPDLAANPEVRAISLDRVMTVQGSGTSNPTTPKSVYRKAVRADSLNSAGYSGRGVTVALIDTGVSGVSDLAGRILPVTDDISGAVTACQNMSGESTCDDSFGHGTFVAGVIAGNGAASNGAYKGVAPEANILSVKIAGRSGAADVSNVLAAIQWVVSFKDRYGIKVLNLSLGTDSTQSYRVDPLDYAVEKAWRSGIVVVVSASNRGPDPSTIAKPGDDPFVITVGAIDDRGTNGLNDDLLPNFTSRGPTAADGLAKPDLVAPGAHVVSLRSPGSAVDEQFPNYVDGSYRKGSGTSFSAGVVSGAAALAVQASPTATPDRVKYAFTSTARAVASTDRMAVGAGLLDAFNGALNAPPGLANVGTEPSSGTGTIDASRGTVYVSADDPMRTVVTGQMTLQLLLWNPLALFADWTGGNWYGGNWYGGNWYGGNWYGGNWYGGNWYGGNWYGQPEGGNWYGGNWYGSAWYGAWE